MKETVDTPFTESRRGGVSWRTKGSNKKKSVHRKNKEEGKGDDFLLAYREKGDIERQGAAISSFWDEVSTEDWVRKTLEPAGVKGDWIPDRDALTGLLVSKSKKRKEYLGISGRGRKKRKKDETDGQDSAVAHSI